jgi:Domain of unknown function (DUF4157)
MNLASRTLSPSIGKAQSNITPVTGPVLQRKCACGNHTIGGGECRECNKKKRFGLQTKLKFNEPGDSYEQEANRIADQVMATPTNPTGSGTPQRIQRFSGPSTGLMDAAPDSVDQALVSPGKPLEPALRQDMEQRFEHDFSRVRVHSGVAAEQSARDVNAHAYTVGQDIVFGAGRFAPGTHAGRLLLAHELTHVLQQMARDRNGHPGFANSAPVIQRLTAFTASDQLAGKSLGWVHPGSADLRVSDDGQMVVEDKGWGAGKDKRAWTTPAKIAASNAILSSQASRVKLVSKGAGISGTAPSSPKTSVKLDEIEPVNATTGGALDLKADCGAACKQVMGSGGADVAVVKHGKSEQYTTPRTYHGGDPTTPEEWSEEIFKKEFGASLTRSAVYAQYAALSAADKKKFDERYGINKFAVPKIGQGLTVSTEKDMPGFALAPGVPASRTWNFHYAATVLASGHDYVTLENAAGWKTTDWIFFMYGPASKAQTFHEFHGATGTHGTAWTTLVVQPEKILHVKTKVKDAPLLIGKTITKLPLGTVVKIIEHSEDKAGNEWRKVEVESGAHTGKVGMLMKSYLN